MTKYIAGIDIGGTFTDCVVIDEQGRLVTAKASSTPPNFAQGIEAALDAAANKLGLSLNTLCGSLSRIVHGTTIGTNALIQKRGAKVGIITTRGHEHCIHIMRGHRGYTGQNIRQVSHFSEGPKPEPIVPKSLSIGVSERIDCFGRVVAPLNERDVIEAVDHLVQRGVEAIAICLLWSFKNPDHERRIVEIIGERAPHVFISASVDLVPKWGEYERTTAVVLNAYIGPITSTYLRTIDERLRELGYREAFQVSQCGGGSISIERALQAPLLTLDSGPVAGVTGSAYLGSAIGQPNIITTDMGGTSFDVGVVHDGEASASYTSSVNQYEYSLPKVDIQVIGAGGGSLAWVDKATSTLRVGPDSAGAMPGPVCYGRGGAQPTVTDAQLVLGYLDGASFAGGQFPLDAEAARHAIAELGSQIGLSTDECAAGICRIVEFNMADLIRRATVEKGQDPRDFVVYAFGGAGPAHAAIFAREAGANRVVIPQRHTASVWCAFGAAAADVVHISEQPALVASPFDLGLLNEGLERLKALSLDALSEHGAEEITLKFSADLRHRGQINEVEVPIDSAAFDEQGIAEIILRFFDKYDATYGKGAAFRNARLEIVTLRCRAIARGGRPPFQEQERAEGGIPAHARLVPRTVYWSDIRERRQTPVFDGDALPAGTQIAGPAIIETSLTTVVVHPGQQLAVDAYGNFEITFQDK